MAEPDLRPTPCRSPSYAPIRSEQSLRGGGDIEDECAWVEANLPSDCLYASMSPSSFRSSFFLLSSFYLLRYSLFLITLCSHCSTHRPSFSIGRRRSRCPPRVCTSLPSTRICTAVIAGRFVVSALTSA